MLACLLVLKYDLKSDIAVPFFHVQYNVNENIQHLPVDSHNEMILNGFPFLLTQTRKYRPTHQCSSFYINNFQHKYRKSLVHYCMNYFNHEDKNDAFYSIENSKLYTVTFLLTL